MSNALAQSVADAARDQTIAMSASGGGLVVGTMAALRYFPVVVGSLTAFASLVLVVLICQKTYYSTKLEKAQLAELERCNLERGTASTRRDDP